MGVHKIVPIYIGKILRGGTQNLIMHVMIIHKGVW